MLLDALRAAEAGELPPGSALAQGAVRIPNAVEAVLEASARWKDVALDRPA
jgi:hypothetical protein